MSRAHQNSDLLLVNRPVVIDDPATAYFSFNNCLASQGTHLCPMVDPTSRSYSGAFNAVEGTDQAYDQSIFMAPAKFGSGIACNESTTNLIPTSINSYPMVGNSWQTYGTDQYNSNTYFSIGTIDNVTNNVITLATIGRPIYTYDVLRPQTTGGGVTAGTYYFIKKISSNSFTLHQYDSSQDGSKGYAVHDNIKNDIRIAVNATNFPTMWHGPAHAANAGLVKEIIPGGFKGLHDCIRCHGEHKPDEPNQDHMAYGVYPPVISGRTYSISFWTRAVTPATVGKTITLSAYTTTDWSLTRIEGNGTYTDCEWHKLTYRGVAPGTGGTNLYFRFGKCGTIDISEIQVEEKSYSTAFAVNPRADTYLQYPNYPIRTASLWVKSTSMKTIDGALTPRTILRQVDINDSYPQWSLYVANTNTTDCLPGTAIPITAGRAILKVKWKTDGVNVTTYLCTVNTINILDGNWHQITCEFGISSKCRLWVDGIYGESTAIPETNYKFEGSLHIGYDSTTDLAGNFLIDELRLDRKTYSIDDILRRYIANTEYYDPYAYGITCI